MAPIDLGNPPAIIRPAPPRGWEYKDGLLRKKADVKKSNFLLNPYIVAAAGGGAGRLSMNGSITFDNSAEYMSRGALGVSSPNRRQFTFSFWLRQTSERGTIFQYDHNGNNNIRINHDINDEFQIIDEGGSVTDIEESTGILPSDTWTHAVLAFDIDQATAADKVKVYLDNVEGSNDGYTVTRDSGLFSEGGGFGGIFIGGAGSNRYGGKLADFILVEGAQLTPAAFGVDKSGTWSWIDYESTSDFTTHGYGDHGFRINPQDDTEIGTDQTGNGYTFSLNAMDSTNFDDTDVPPT